MPPRDVLDFASDDALGLAGDPRIAAAVRRGSAADARQQLAQELGALLGRPGTAVVPEADTAAAAVAAARLGAGDVAFVEATAPRRWVNEIRAAGADAVTFPRHDVAALDRMLCRRNGRQPVVVVEGVSSLAGDITELNALLDACDAHRAALIVDETHGAFALGPRGGGATDLQGEARRVRVVAGATSPALGMEAGFVSTLHAGPEDRPPADGALPAGHSAGLLTAVQIAADESDRRDRLAANAAYFRAALRAMGLETGRSTTHVIPIVIRRRDLFATASARLGQRGLALAAAGSAQSPDGVSRFWVRISSAHTHTEMDRALAVIEDAVARPVK